MTEETLVSDRLKKLADKHLDELWKISHELTDLIYFSAGYLRGLEERQKSTIDERK